MDSQLLLEKDRHSVWQKNKTDINVILKFMQFYSNHSMQYFFQKNHVLCCIVCCIAADSDHVCWHDGWTLCFYILRLQGQERPLLIFTFEKFKIGRYVTAMVTDPLLDQVKYTEATDGGTRQYYNNNRSVSRSDSDSWIIPGQRYDW